MRAFRALARNVVRASFRNRVAMFFTLGLAVLFMVIFGLLFGGNKLSLSLDVVDHDDSPVSHQYVSALGSVDGLTVKATDADTASSDLKHGNISAYLVLPSGFGAALGDGSATRREVELHTASVTSSSASITSQVVGQITSGFVAGYTHAGPPPVTLGRAQTEAVNQVTAIDYFLPAMIAYIILQSGINFVAIGLVDLRARQVLRRLRATPIRPAQILAAQVTGGALTVLLQIVILIAIGIGLFQAHSYGNWLVAVVPILCGTAAFVGIGFLLTSAVRTSEAARGLSSLIAFPMMFLSGVFFPIDQLPKILQTLVHVLPLTWLTDAMHQVMNDGAGLSAIAVDCLVLVGWAVATFSIATWRFRWE